MSSITEEEWDAIQAELDADPDYRAGRAALPRILGLDSASGATARAVPASRRSSSSATVRRPTVDPDTADQRIAAHFGRGWSERDGTYELVKDADVDDDVLQAAGVARAFAAAHLAIAKPTMRFYEEESETHAAYRAKYGTVDWPAFRGPSGLNGLAIRDTEMIGIRADLTLGRTVEVVAHEVRHLVQVVTTDVEASEDDAEAYGDWARGVLVDASSGKVAGAVHVLSSRPLSFLTLKHEADPGDVVIARFDGQTRVYRNVGLKAYGAQWREHWQACPVPLRPSR